MRLTLRVATLFLAVLTLLPLPVQAAATTGNIFGVVTDDSGAALPGVTVTISGPTLQGTRSAVTNERGEYNFQLLSPGNYRLDFALAGLSPSTRENVRVSLDTTTRQDVSMAMGAVSEAITVSADAVVVDPTQTTVQQNFGENHLKYATVGSAGRSYQNVLQQAPGVAGGANPNVLGANSGQNNYLLDGVNTTDPVTHTFGSNLPFDAIQEISIQTLGKDAEYGRAIGGVVNVVTKSGGNEFSGSFDARYNSNETQESTDLFPNAQEFDELRPSATLGGPILRDRLWFFLSGQQPDTTRINAPLPNAGFSPGPRTFKGTDLLGKLTFTPLENHTLSVRYTTNEATVEHTQSSAFYRPEADSVQKQESTIYNAGYDVIINPSWLAQVQVGARTGSLDTRPMSGDLTTPGVTDAATSIRSVNYTNFQYSQRDRNELIASTSYFSDNLFNSGSHTFEVGANYDEATFPRYNNATGVPPAGLCSPEFGFPAGANCSATITLNTTAAGLPGGAVGNVMSVSSIIPETTFESELLALYAQDEWHPITPITLRLGLRYETVDFHAPNRNDAPQLSKLQPRLGAAWDIFNNANSVLYGFWGQVMDDNGLTLASFGNSIGSVNRLFRIEPNGTYTPLGVPSGSPTVGNQYDPDLRATYSTEANIGFRQRLWTNTSLDLTAVWRETSDIFEDTCSKQTPGTIPPCQPFIMTNDPAGQGDALSSEYRGAIARLESRPFSWLSGLVSYTWSESQGSLEYTQNAGSDFDVFPHHFVNRYGYLSDDAEHRIKVSGFVRVPWGTTVGLDYNWDSGTPYNTTASAPPTGAIAGSNTGTLFVEPRGSHRLPEFDQLNLQLQHDFNLGRFRLGLIGSVLNVLGTETPTSVGTSIGSYNFCRTSGATIDTVCLPNPLFGITNGETRANPATGTWERLRVTSTTYGQPTAWQRPRRYEVGFRIEF